MQIKKTAGAVLLFSAVATFVSFNFVGAQNWVPMVQIPGIPAGGVNLSLYLVGLYDFLLSVVGIVAVLMLILGGMRYITAAGNQAAASDAKDIITNAIAGLLLAILSWVIVSEINPDVLYIKKPSSEFAGSLVTDLGQCGTYDPAVPTCTCIDGAVIVDPAIIDQESCSAGCRGGVKTFDYLAVPPCICNDGSNINTTKRADCEVQCLAGSHCELENKGLCLGKGGSNEITNGVCSCADGSKDVKPTAAAIAAGEKCNEICSNATLAADALYHGIIWNLEIGEDIDNLSPAEKTTVTFGNEVYYNFSGVRDCKGATNHIAVDFNGGPTFVYAPDIYCCFKNAPGCAFFSWGQVCDNINTTAFLCHSTPQLRDGCSMFPAVFPFPACIPHVWPLKPVHWFPPEEDNYPIYKHTYDDLDLFLNPVLGVEQVWVGVSYVDNLGSCANAPEHLFQIDVVAP